MKKFIKFDLNMILLIIVLLAGIAFSAIKIVFAVDPNPGHIWSEIDDAALGETQGGTDQTTYTKGDMLYSDSANNLAKLGIGTPGYVLSSSGGLPAWAATTTLTTISGTLGETKGGLDQTTYTKGDILYADAANNLTKLPIGSPGYILASLGGIPTWIATNTPVTVQVFNSDGTYTPTAGMTKALYIVVGGGGAGATCSTDNDVCSGGGGGGGTAIKLVTAADVGANDSVEVGAQAASGSDGDQSLIGSVSASGGSVGTQSASSATVGTGAAGGAGGIGSGGDLNIKGQAGGGCFKYSTSNGSGGAGGSSMFGGGGAGSITASVGGDGGAYGGGGGGCHTIDTTNYNSGAGAVGVVYVIEFFN